jgi:hypothetical protein
MSDAFYDWATEREAGNSTRRPTGFWPFLPPAPSLKRGLFTCLLVLSLGCTAAPAPKDYQAQDGYRMLQAALPFALKGNREAIHDCFLAAYLRASSPMQGGEDCEAIGSGLCELLFRGRDRSFSEALAVERPEVIAAAKLWIGDKPRFSSGKGFKSFRIADYPRTRKLLDSAPDTDFPYREASPLQAPLLEQLSP